MVIMNGQVVGLLRGTFQCLTEVSEGTHKNAVKALDGVLNTEIPYIQTGERI
jgi:type III secretory pathway component EscS